MMVFLECGRGKTANMHHMKRQIRLTCDESTKAESDIIKPDRIDKVQLKQILLSSGIG